MRKFDRKQILPMKGDTSRNVIDYNSCDKISHAKEIRQEWAGCVNLKESMYANRYQSGYVDEYKKWLEDDLLGTLNPGPCMGRQIEDEVRLQLQAYHFQQQWDQIKQEYLCKEQEFQQREYES
ncbi:hypothetical protein KY284_010893 [Solanum tuberosum]|nr:hypothetical protein KY284_010893 [Solanum tuberosum]